MAEHGTAVRDVMVLEVARVGRVEETGERLQPFRLLDQHGVEVAAVTEFLHHMLADDASPAWRACRLSAADASVSCARSGFPGIWPGAPRLVTSPYG